MSAATGKLESGVVGFEAAGQPSDDSVHVTLLRMRNGTVVWGSDGELGPVLAIVVDPATKTATQIAVRNGDVAGTGRMVPVGQVISATVDRIEVGLTRSQFFRLERFFVPYRAAHLSDHDPSPDIPAWSDVWLMRPGTFLLGVHENVPSDRVPVHRGLRVLGSDGEHIGTVESWNLEPGTGQLASVAFAGRQLLRRRHFLVDASSIATIDESGLRLTESAADVGDVDDPRGGGNADGK